MDLGTRRFRYLDDFFAVLRRVEACRAAGRRCAIKRHLRCRDEPHRFARDRAFDELLAERAANVLGRFAQIAFATYGARNCARDALLLGATMQRESEPTDQNDRERGKRAITDRNRIPYAAGLDAVDVTRNDVCDRGRRSRGRSSNGDCPRTRSRRSERRAISPQ